MLDYRVMERMIFWRVFIAMVTAALLGGGLVAAIFWIF
jgi:hypothetical protein